MKPWVMFGGVVLVVVMLYWAQAVFVPIALAALLSFVLSPPVNWLERWLGRVPAVLLVVTLVFVVLALAGWGLARQMNGLVEDLPRYRVNILSKINDVRGAGRGGTVEKLQETIDDIKTDLEKTGAVQQGAPQQVVVAPNSASNIPGFAWLGPLMGPLGTAGLVVAFVIFMLLERRDLRNRLIGLVGDGRLTVTTKAFDEASSRVSRQLLMQTLVNGVYGVGVGVGLYFIGVPYALVWASLSAVLRFIPYIGPIIGAAAPILMALAALEGWTRPLGVMGLFLALELFTNLVLETILYAGAAGVSQVALLIAIAFWTWLWGPMGLLMATPLTVCLVVLGKHVPGMEFLATLMSDAPTLAPEMVYYQRLLARDPSEASDLIDNHIKTQSAETVYDTLLLPALNYAERDRLEGRLTTEEEGIVVEATRELMSDAAVASRASRVASAESPVGKDGFAAVDTEALVPAMPAPTPVPVLAYPSNGLADELALRMLGQLLVETPVTLDITGARMLASEMVTAIRDGGYQIVCVADLPPSPPSRTRYLVRKLRAALPDLKIVVGRWAPPVLADDNTKLLMDAGASSVSTTLVQARDELVQFARLAPPRAL